jgi:cardiolipin synthase
MQTLTTLADSVLAIWPYLLTSAVVVCAVCAGCHAVMYKRDPRAAAGWLGVIVMFPLVGTLVYYFLGINRIQRKAARTRSRQLGARCTKAQVCTQDELRAALPPGAAHLMSLNTLVARITQRPLLEGNLLEPLQNGDTAYPAMLDAIARARHSIALATYIFDNDNAGRMFVDALAQAVRRGVAVRVLVDAIGARYSRPSIMRGLRAAGVPAHVFMPTNAPIYTKYMNLRNHRKLLIVDGSEGYAGGMNIRAGNLLQQAPRHAVQDLHFRVRGPVVAQLQEGFAEDWLFAAGETLRGAAWYPPLAAAGTMMARGVADGPDEDFGKLARVLHGALACAQRSVQIVTPYFLPTMPLISALNTCALRGVQVDIVLPSQNNLRTVGWAMMAQIWQVLEWGCRVWLTPPPFDHSKLVVVDDEWCLVGSANWDPRSLRLNFEYNIECYSQTLAAQLRAIVTAKCAAARPLTLQEADGRPFPVRLRDNLARMFTPYL